MRTGRMMILVAGLGAALLCGAAEELSVAEKVARVDAGARIVKKADVTRVAALLEQMAARYGTNELRVADCAVVAAGLLRDKYGIETTLQALLEDLNRIEGAGGAPDLLDALAVAYVRHRNQGKSGREAVDAVNLELRPSGRDGRMKQQNGRSP